MGDQSPTESGGPSLERLRENPGTVSAAGFVEAVADPDVPISVATTAFGTVLREGEIDPADAAATLSESLTDRSHGNRVGVAELLAVLATESPGALLPHADTLIETVMENEPGGTELASVLPVLARADPDAMLARADDIVALLEANLPAVRLGATGTLVVLATDRPDALTGYAPDLVALLGRDEPTLGETADRVAEGRPRTPETLREQLSETRKQLYASREGAALVLHDLAVAEPETVAPHADALAGVIDGAVFDRIRALVLETLARVARDRPEAVVGVRAVAVEELTVEGADEAQESAARLLATLAETHGESVATALQEGDAVSVLATLLDARGVDESMAGSLNEGGDSSADTAGDVGPIPGDKAEDRGVRTHAASLLVALSEHAPTACTTAREELEAAADGDDPEIRELAGTAIERLEG
jgi:hypothetical protein